jgi:hypothetical protein
MDIIVNGVPQVTVIIGAAFRSPKPPCSKHAGSPASASRWKGTARSWRRACHAETLLAAGDRIEIVVAVGGG